MLALDLGVLHRDQHEIGVRESLALSAGYLAVGLTLGSWVWHQLSAQAGLDYVTGFLIETSLALDNVFVIATIFAAFAIPRVYQYRVLFWGVLGVIVLRGLMIGFGASLVASFTWMLWIFAAFLIAMGVKMVFAKAAPKDPHDSALYRWLAGRGLGEVSSTGFASDPAGLLAAGIGGSLWKTHASRAQP